MNYKLSDFDFELPNDQIAQSPPLNRTASKMMVLDKSNSEIINDNFFNLIDYLDENYFIVFNNTTVRKARMFTVDGKHEFLFIKKIDDTNFLCMTKKISKKKIGDSFILQGGMQITITETKETYVTVKTQIPLTEEYFLLHGHIPLPPYIKRQDNSEDELRYQTVFSKITGSIASPTASLHFDEDTLEKLSQKNINHCFVTLHVGLGTFLPVKTENITEHNMHYETYFISKESADKINEAVKDKKKILAIGTTAVRTLETCMTKYGEIKEINGEDTNLFIYPGYEYKIVNSIFTNFHTPKSTLLMLICAFYGYEKTMNVYKTAVENNYRFFSYGDCMLIK